MAALQRVSRAWGWGVLPLGMLAAGVGGAIGCGGDDSPKPAPAPTVEPASPTPPARPVPTSPAGKSPPAAPAAPAEPVAKERPMAVPGAAYIAVRGKGLVVLTTDGFASVPGTETLGPLRQVALGPADAPYTLGPGGVGRIEGESWVLKFPATGEGEGEGAGETEGASGWTRFAVASDGTPWVISAATVARGGAGGWSVENASAVGATSDLLDVAIDAEGRPWVSSEKGLRYRDDRGWHEANDGAFSALSADAGGDGMLAFGTTPARVRGPAAIVDLSWTGTAPTEGALPAWGAHTGAAWVAEGKRRVQWRDDFGERRYTGQDVLPGQVGALALDAAARVWVATDAGISVLSPKGTTRWPLGSVAQLAGPIDGFAVVGGGPPLPEAGPIQTGTLEGTILLDGKPLVGALMELCPQPGTRVKSTPCEASGLRRELVTDASGRFSAANVPLGAYGVGVKVAGAWKITFGGAYGADMKGGERYDIGSLDFQADGP